MGGGGARQDVREGKERRLGFREVQALIRIGRGRRGERGKKKIGESWGLLAKQKKACLGEIIQKEVVLETAGFVSRDFQDPRRKRNLSWLAEDLNRLGCLWEEN